MVGLVFTEQGTLFQHAAIVIVCATQLIVHARTQPYSTWTENSLQYLGTFWTFAMSFGGMLLQNLKVSQKEAAQRLFGKEAEDTMVSYDYSIQSVEEAITVIMVLVIISAVGVLAYEQWEKRQESRATLGKLGGKMKQGISKLAACCECGTADVRNSPEAKVELPTIDMDHPNPMYGQHGRAMQANEGGMEAAARAVSTSFVSKSFLEGGGLNVEAAPRVVSAAFESSRVMPSATRVSGIKKKQIEWSPTAVSVRGLVTSTTPTTPSGSTSPAETKEATLRGVEKPEAAARDAGGGGGEDGINEGVESKRPDLTTGARGKVGVVEGSGRRPKSLQL